MKILFKFLILFILSITCNATSYDIENLDKKDKQSIEILNTYLKQTDLKMQDFPNINFVLGTKETISSINKLLYNEINKFTNYFCEKE